MARSNPLRKRKPASSGKTTANGCRRGRGTPQAVERFSGAGWRGMRATITCGISDPETGFHAAGGECYWAVLSNGKRAAVANTRVSSAPTTR